LFLLHVRPIHAFDLYVHLFERDYAIPILLLGLLIGSLVWKVYATGLFVLGKERLFAFICIATFLAGAGFKILGAGSAGLPGLAIGTSLYWGLGAACMALGFLRNVKACKDGAERKDQEPLLEIVPKFESAD